jgi:hypothetical protein
MVKWICRIEPTLQPLKEKELHTARRHIEAMTFFLNSILAREIVLKMVAIYVLIIPSHTYSVF